MEDLGVAIDQDGQLILHMQILAVGATAVGATTSPLALDEGAGEHFAERREAADESCPRNKIRAAFFETGICRCMILQT